MKHFPIILASTALLLLALAAWWVSKMQEAIDERPDPNQAGLEELLPKKEAAAPGEESTPEPADTEPAAPEEPVYTTGEKTRDGTGKYYMGREIAYVMGHQAINWLERDNREDEEAPSKAIAALDLKPDSVLADIGAGSGYYTFRIAPLVPKGKVVAVDIQQEMIDFLEAREKELGFDNVEAHLGTVEDTKLPPNSIDAALMVDAYHEFSHPREMMQSIFSALRPGGRVILLEYRAEDPRVPIKPLHKMTEEQSIREMEVVGLKHVKTHDFLPWQHFMVFMKP